MSVVNLELLPQIRNLSGRPADWKPNAGFAKLVEPDDALAAIVGHSPMTRSELGKRLWDYIRRNNLQDAGNGRVIHIDHALGKIFTGRKHAGAMELLKHVSVHLKP